MSTTVELGRQDHAVPAAEPVTRPRGGPSARRQAVLAIGATILDPRRAAKPQPLSQSGIARRVLSLAAVLVSLLAGCTPSTPSASTSPSVTVQTTGTSSTSATPSPSAPPIDTSNWVTYTSKRYHFSLKHPPGWKVLPAERDWTLKADAGHLSSGGQEGLVSPAGDLFIGMWSTPVGDTTENLEGVAAWVEKFCTQGGLPCPGLLERAVPLCHERWDCHPGLLVPSPDNQEFRAFFTDADHGGRIVGLDVGLPEWAPEVKKYGGARGILEALLSTMDVCPARPDQTPRGCPK